MVGNLGELLLQYKRFTNLVVANPNLFTSSLDLKMWACETVIRQSSHVEAFSTVSRILKKVSVLEFNLIQQNSDECRFGQVYQHRTKWGKRVIHVNSAC